MKTLDVLVAHPLKHHVFPLAAGIQRSGVSMRLLTPFYCKGVGRLIAALPGSAGDKAKGYHYGGLDTENVITPWTWQLRKLKHGGNSNELVREFDDYASARIASGDLRARVLVTMQDYLPKTVLAGKKAGMLIWSDQILNSSQSATDRIATHYEIEGVRNAASHDEAINDFILSMADLVTVPSQYTFNGITGRVATSATVHIVPYGVDNQRFNVHRQKHGDMVRIIARANSIRKGGHLLVDALMKCGQELRELVHGRSIEVVIIGALEPVLDERLRKAKFPDGITIRSAVVPHILMPEVLASADLFVMPSLSEGMSLICIEAMQAGLPLIITSYCGVDCFEHLRMGVETSDSSDALALSLIVALNHSSQWKEWGHAAANTANRLGWDAYEKAIATVTLNFFSETLPESPYKKNNDKQK